MERRFTAIFLGQLKLQLLAKFLLAKKSLFIKVLDRRQRPVAIVWILAQCSVEDVFI